MLRRGARGAITQKRRLPGNPEQAALHTTEPKLGSGSGYDLSCRREADLKISLDVVDVLEAD